MSAKLIVPGLHVIPVGGVNTFLIDDPDGCVLIDAGYPGKADVILKGIAAAGKRAADVRHIIVTHAHGDHIGSLAAMKAATGAAIYCHPADRGIVEAGHGFRRLNRAPGAINWVLYQIISRQIAKMPRVDPTAVDHELADGQVLPIAGGLRVVHVPGHCAGQVAVLWPRHGGVLFAADVAMNVMGLALTFAYEDLAEGERSLRKVGRLDFAVACFGHGKAITADAAERFRRRWPAG